MKPDQDQYILYAQRNYYSICGIVQNKIQRADIGSAINKDSQLYIALIAATVRI